MPVTGREFLGRLPALYDRIVKRAYFYRSEGSAEIQEWLELSVNEVTAKPSRAQLATLRLAFDDPA